MNLILQAIKSLLRKLGADVRRAQATAETAQATAETARIDMELRSKDDGKNWYIHSGSYEDLRNKIFNNVPVNVKILSTRIGIDTNIYTGTHYV